MKRTLFALFLTGGFFLPAGISEGRIPQAQTEVKAKQEAQEHEVTVTVKLVQVYVTDPKGNPARDLEKSDFILYDNGRLQEISSIEKHFLLAPQVALEETKPSPARDLASLLNRKFIFIIDYEGDDLEAVAKSKKAILEFIDTQVQPGDEISLFSFSLVRGLVLHEYLTADHKQVRAALKKPLDIPGISGGWDFGSVILPGEAGGVVPASGDPRVSLGTPVLALPSGGSGLDRRLQELALGLRHIPGPKNIILFMRGFGTGVLIRGSHAHRIFTDMAKILASANCPVFSVYTPVGQGAKKKVFSDGSLEYLSRLTGGKYLSDVNYESRIAAEIQNATSNYYVLGYSIASNWDGKFHDIKVEVKRPGYKVHAQSGYFNPLPFSRLSPVEKHLHLLDLALGEKAYFAQHLNFPLIALPFSDKLETNTVLISEIPVLKIREAVGESTECITLVFDQNKTIVSGQRVEFDWRKIGGERVFQHEAVALPPGQYDCRVIIRNLDNGKAAAGACSVEIPEKAAGDLRLFPPLLLIPGLKTRYLNISGQADEATASPVSLPEIFPFPQDEYRPLIGALEQGTNLIYAAVRCVWTAAQEPALEISALLLPEGSAGEIPLPCSVLGSLRQGEIDGLFLEIELPELQPGRYLLRLLAEDKATGTSSQTTSGFSVKR